MLEHSDLERYKCVSKYKKMMAMIALLIYASWGVILGTGILNEIDVAGFPVIWIIFIADTFALVVISFALYHSMVNLKK